MRLVISPLQTGVLVLLYYSSYYAIRGGYSGYGANCGVFFIVAGTGAGGYSWYIGAALSFRLSTHYTFRGGFSLDGIRCGAFFDAVSDSSNATAWHRGAALLLLHIILIVVVNLVLVTELGLGELI